jgi:hypothetical protein
MKLRSVHLLFVLAGLAVFSGPIYAARFTLLGEVDVQADSIFLSDLLPPQVPPELRRPAQSILIGTAPQPGNTRVLEGVKIASMLGTDISREIGIPNEIVVHRTGRRLTREEVVAVIRTALGRNGFPGADLQPDDLRVFPSVMVSSADAPLEVRRVDFDDVLNEARFLMAQRGSLPFLVTARLRDRVPADAGSQKSAPGVGVNSSESANARLEDLLGRHALRQAAQGTSLSDAQRGSATLVEPGKPATLHLSSSGAMQMLLDVIPLERGTLNQTVRVKLPGTGKILHGRVTGARRLEATF